MKRLLFSLVLLTGCAHKVYRHPAQESVSFDQSCSSFTSENQRPWAKVASVRFGIIEGFDRNQGFATDGEGNFWFSGKKVLLKSKKDFSSTEVKNSKPFSNEMEGYGGNHIGDIDYSEDRLYVPVEDGKKYQNPVLGIYDAKSLAFLKSFLLPVDWQPDGLPWIAVSSVRREIFSSKYGQATKINVYDSESLVPLRQIELSQKIDEIQGGQVVGNTLFLSGDEADTSKAFAIYEVDLHSGKVEKTLPLPSSVIEVEGIGLVSKPDSCDLYVLTVSGKGLGIRSKLFHFKK